VSDSQKTAVIFGWQQEEHRLGHCSKIAGGRLALAICYQTNA